MQTTTRDVVARSLELSIRGLVPFVTEVMTPLIPAGTTWMDVLEQRDLSNGIRNRTYTANDLQGLLRMITERMGNLGYPFSSRLTRGGQALASELREVRNNWAHHVDFSTDDAWRSIDTVERLLHAIGDPGRGDEAALLKSTIRPVVDFEAVPDKTTAPVEPKTDSMHVSDTGRLHSSHEPHAEVTLEFAAVPVLSYAAAHNRVPILSSVTIKNRGAAKRGAVLTLDAGAATGRLDLESAHFVDLAAESSVTLTDAGLLLDPARMLAVEERRPGFITARLEFEGETLAREAMQVEVLAAHQWVSAPSQLALELLASFVMPNHPAIARLLGEASEILMAKTGSSSLEGYQSGAERVDQIASAIFDAMQLRRIRYSNPPASWGDGQKVRTPEEVLEGRVGTCLDTTVVMAAALEQAGVNPQLWIVEGHAFLGYWREEVDFGAPAVTDPRALRNLVDLSLLALVETTLITESQEPATFREASRRPVTTWLDEQPERLIGVTDVASARRSKVFPLPARTTDPDGNVTVIHYRPVSPAEREYAEYEKTAPKNSSGDPVVPFRVSQWKNSLLDLSLRNRLINFTERGRLRLAVPDGDVAHLEDLVNDNRPVRLVPSDAVAQIQRERGIRYGRDLPEPDRTAMLRDRLDVFADVTDAAYQTRLRALAYKARTIAEETGANNLYLSFGTLDWEFNRRSLSSPLVLVPVRLIPGRGGRYEVRLDESGASTPNYCLLEKLKITHKLSIPGLATPLEDGAGIDLDAAFEAIRVALAEAGLPFRVRATVDLAILQFAKFRLWKDLDDSWVELAKNQLVRHLIYTPSQPFVDEIGRDPIADLDGLAAQSPVLADSSQLAAVADAVADRTFVLEGPPGTGKSQTITNLLVRAVADDKRVLFVAEKRAALDVVQRRLEEVGLAPFTLDLHDKGSRPLAVRTQIKAALGHRVTTDTDGLETDLNALLTARKSLERYAGKVHEPNEAGLSLYAARNKQLAGDPDVPTMPIPSSFLKDVTSPTLRELRGVLSLMPDSAEPARPRPDHPWAVLNTAPPHLDAPRIFSASVGLDHVLRRVRPHLEEFLPWMGDAFALEHLKNVVGAPRFPLVVVDAARANDWSGLAARAMGELSALLSEANQLRGISLRFIELPFDEIHEAAQRADASSFFGRKKRRLEVISRFVSVVDAAALPRPAGVTAFTAHLNSWRSRVSAVRVAFARVAGLEQAADWNPLLETSVERLQRQLDWIGWVSQALAPDMAGISARMTGLTRSLYASTEPEPAAARWLDELGSALVGMTAAVGTDVVELGKAWAAPHEFFSKWRSNADDRSRLGESGLQRWVDLLDSVELLRKVGLTAARIEILEGKADPEVALPSFENGLAAESLIERLASTGLDAFLSERHDRTIRRFDATSDAVREHLTTSIPADLLSRRTFDPTASGGQVGELRRQLERKSGGLGVRGLFEKFGPLITQLIPCMLMSPESVARFFPAQADLFDIVVFDEASQVRVADAIGAIGRSRSVVVVGDSKQMPPTSFAESSSRDDEMDEEIPDVVLDQESILSECVTARVPRRTLTWHYRSQDESLISFSNDQYYDGKLSSFPSPLHGRKDDSITGHGISLVRVNGEFLRSGVGRDLRTNPVEAEAIVDEIQRRFWDSPDAIPSLGVVTFNAPQRTRIEEHLRDAGDPRIIEALDNSSDGLFVKNLENVQGDERDVILFSTAFSADKTGRLPLNFGPLSQGGGERRLNVAITRARRQVIMFSSFDPSALRAEESTSVGLKHLRAYLELAALDHTPRSATRYRDEAVDRHRDDIASALRERGYAVTTDIGLSDFRVDLSVASREDASIPIAAILLDNTSWAARRTVADRDGLPGAVLKNLMNWPSVQRIWIPHWLSRRDEVLDQVCTQLDLAVSDSAISVALDGLEEPPAQLPSAHIHADETTRVLAGTQPAGAESHVTPTGKGPQPRSQAPIDFVPWAFRRAGSVAVLDLLPSRSAQGSVSAVIAEVIETEGPVHSVRLAKLVASAFGLDRVAQARAVGILSCLPMEFRRRGDAFAWPREVDTGSWSGFRRTPENVPRPLEHVHPLEIVNAMRWLCEKSAGLYVDELRRTTIHFFGVQRMTPRITELLDNASKLGYDRGLLLRQESGLVTSSSGNGIV